MCKFGNLEFSGVPHSFSEFVSDEVMGRESTFPSRQCWVTRLKEFNIRWTGSYADDAFGECQKIIDKSSYQGFSQTYLYYHIRDPKSKTRRSNDTKFDIHQCAKAAVVLSGKSAFEFVMNRSDISIQEDEYVNDSINNKLKPNDNTKTNANIDNPYHASISETNTDIIQNNDCKSVKVETISENGDDVYFELISINKMNNMNNINTTETNTNVGNAHTLASKTPNTNHIQNNDGGDYFELNGNKVKGNINTSENGSNC
eukprot:Pgem_evm1s18539